MQSNSSQHPQAVERPALVSGDLLGSCVPIDGWYVARPPAERGGPDECVFVRLDDGRQEYVLDVVGQQRKYSEELKRYKGWLFWPVAMPNP